MYIIIEYMLILNIYNIYIKHRLISLTSLNGTVLMCLSVCLCVVCMCIKLYKLISTEYIIAK